MSAGCGTQAGFWLDLVLVLLLLRVAVQESGVWASAERARQRGVALATLVLALIAMAGLML